MTRSPDRNTKILAMQESLLDRHFPGEPRPPLLELEARASLGLHVGHPLLADGNRPVAPNFHYVGMMNCRRHPEAGARGPPGGGGGVGEELASFLEGAEHGAVYVAFGSALNTSQMDDGRRRTFVNVFRCARASPDPQPKCR